MLILQIAVTYVTITFCHKTLQKTMLLSVNAYTVQNKTSITDNSTHFVTNEATLRGDNMSGTRPIHVTCCAQKPKHALCGIPSVKLFG